MNGACLVVGIPELTNCPPPSPDIMRQPKAAGSGVGGCPRMWPFPGAHTSAVRSLFSAPESQRGKW